MLSLAYINTFDTFPDLIFIISHVIYTHNPMQQINCRAGVRKDDEKYLKKILRHEKVKKRFVIVTHLS